jgi:hypothetical protein
LLLFLLSSCLWMPDTTSWMTSFSSCEDDGRTEKLLRTDSDSIFVAIDRIFQNRMCNCRTYSSYFRDEFWPGLWCYNASHSSRPNNDDQSLKDERRIILACLTAMLICRTIILMWVIHKAKYRPLRRFENSDRWLFLSQILRWIFELSLWTAAWWISRSRNCWE